MEKLIDVLPIIMLGIGQFMLALVCMNQTKRITMLEEKQSMVMEWQYEALMEVLNGQQE